MAAPRKPNRSQLASVPALAVVVDRNAIRRRYDVASGLCLELYDPSKSAAQQSDEWRAACESARQLFTEWTNERG